MLQLSCPAEKTRHTHTHTRKAEATADSLSFPRLPPCTEGAKLGVGTFVGIYQREGGGAGRNRRRDVQNKHRPPPPPPPPIDIGFIDVRTCRTVLCTTGAGSRMGQML